MLTSAPSSPPHSQPAPATSPPVPVHYKVIEWHEAELNNRGSPRILCVMFFISEASLQNRGSKCVNIVASVTRTHAESDGYYLKQEKGNARECRSVFTLVPWEWLSCCWAAAPAVWSGSWWSLGVWSGWPAVSGRPPPAGRSLFLWPWAPPPDLNGVPPLPPVPAL